LIAEQSHDETNIVFRGLATAVQAGSAGFYWLVIG
jgi:hypothetical protein